MIRGFLREEFDRGHGLWFLVAAIPLALLVSLFLPDVLLPFVASLPLFTLFFYYLRKGRCVNALRAVLIHCLLLFVLLFLLQWIRGGDAGNRLTLFTTGVAGAPFSFRLGQSFFVMLLSGLSGGGLAILSWGVAIENMAQEAVVVARSGGFAAALLSITPWVLAEGVAQACFAIAAALMFYAKLERRSFSGERVLRWFLVGLAFVILDLYLETYLSPTWNVAFQQSLSIY